MVTFDVFARFLSRFWPYRGLYMAICGPNRVIVGWFRGLFRHLLWVFVFFALTTLSRVTCGRPRSGPPVQSRRSHCPSQAPCRLWLVTLLCVATLTKREGKWCRQSYRNVKRTQLQPTLVCLRDLAASKGCGSCQLLLSGHIGWWATKANTIPIESRRTHCDERLTPKWEILFHRMWQFRGRSVKHEANDS